MTARTAVFDLDGTLLDSDAALLAAFVSLGVAPEDVIWGQPVARECARLGVALERYVAAYDCGAALPFPGVADLLGRLDRWGVCSNKHGGSGWAELRRLGWTPGVALFTEDFGGDAPKRLGPVLEALGVAASDVIFVGDTPQDAACAAEAGAAFAVAGWNGRSAGLAGDHTLSHPLELLDLL